MVWKSPDFRCPDICDNIAEIKHPPNGAVHLLRVKNSQVEETGKGFSTTEIGNRCGASHQVKQHG